MRNTFRILFYLKKNAPLRDGRLPIMARITICGQRVQLSTHLAVARELWNASGGQAAGRSRTARELNRHMDDIRYRLEACYRKLFLDGSFVTPAMVKEAYFGVAQRPRRLLDFFRRHNEEFRRMVGVSRCQATYNKYRCVCRHLERYILRTYRRCDLAFDELDKDFLTGFHAYIIRQCGHRKNTAWIYMIALKHILMLARSKGYLNGDLFAGYKLRSEFVARNYLTLDEIDRLVRSEPPSATLRLVRDAFLFSCFTGLSYVDLRGLTRRHIQHNRGHAWIDLTRRKTGTGVSVRLFALPLAILERYFPAAPDDRIFALPGNDGATNAWNGSSPRQASRSTSLPCGAPHLRHDHHPVAGRSHRDHQQTAGAQEHPHHPDLCRHHPLDARRRDEPAFGTHRRTLSQRHGRPMFRKGGFRVRNVPCSGRMTRTATFRPSHFFKKGHSALRNAHYDSKAYP